MRSRSTTSVRRPGRSATWLRRRSSARWVWMLCIKRAMTGAAARGVCLSGGSPVRRLRSCMTWRRSIDGKRIENDPVAAAAAAEPFFSLLSVGQVSASCGAAPPPQAVSSKCFSFGHHNKKSGNTSSISGFFMEIGRMRAAQSLPSPCSERPLGGGAPAPGTGFRFPSDPASSFSAQSCRGRQGFPLPFSFAFHGPRRSGRRSWSSPSATRNCPSGSSDSSP